MITKKVLLDTDIGNDIDDAFALAYLLRQPACELMGITTVSGETNKRAAMASAMCQAAGRPDIPIFPGVEQPLLARQLQPETTQFPAIAQVPHQEAFPAGKALRHMQETIRANPGDISLLAIGPMTNVALLFAMDPEIPALLKELVLMCGVFTYKLQPYLCLSEWNARCDPHATAMVYRAGVPASCSIGLDVTTRTTMGVQDIRSRLSGPVGSLLGRFLDARGASQTPVTFHDPLAAAVMFEPEVCRFEKGRVRVELESTALAGLTEWQAEKDGPHSVAFDVNAPAFFRHYWDVLGAQG